jgi:hypothetical protein
MPLSYRPALESGIHYSSQARQKTRPMDVHVHVTVLRLQSEYLARLFTQVGAQLSTLEHTLSEGHALTAAGTVGLLGEVASLQSRLCTEGEMFCKRVHLFLAEAQPSPDSRKKLSQHPSA